MCSKLNTSFSSTDVLSLSHMHNFSFVFLLHVLLLFCFTEITNILFEMLDNSLRCFYTLVGHLNKYPFIIGILYFFVLLTAMLG